MCLCSAGHRAPSVWWLVSGARKAKEVLSAGRVPVGPVRMIRAGSRESLEGLAAALAPIPELAASLRRIPDMSSKEITHNLRCQSAEVRRTAELLIDAVVEGRLDESPRRRGKP